MRGWGTPQPKADVRILGATNADLSAAVQEGRFAKICSTVQMSFPIDLPPLCERSATLRLWPSEWLEIFRGAKPTRSCGIFPTRALQRLKAYDWPGNLRELRNVVERAAILMCIRHYRG